MEVIKAGAVIISIAAGLLAIIVCIGSYGEMLNERAERKIVEHKMEFYRERLSEKEKEQQ